jgi:hypothetical protein
MSSKCDDVFLKVQSSLNRVFLQGAVKLIGSGYKLHLALVLCKGMHGPVDNISLQGRGGYGSEKWPSRLFCIRIGGGHVPHPHLSGGSATV